MTNKTFNQSLFNKLVYINNDRDYFSSKESGLERVLKVLHQSSDTSREARLNHNCRITGLPFCWRYWQGYGDDATEVKVLSFPMTKISTGWSFILDIEENGALYLSEGKGTARTSLKLSALNAFSPTTREDMFSVIEHLCNSSVADNPSPEELFWFYKQVLTDAGVETVYQVFDDTEEPYLYKAQQVKGITETRYLQFDRRFNNPHPYDDALAEQPKKHILFGRWCEEHQRWYVDVVFEDSAWGFSCLQDPGSYPFIEFNGTGLTTPPCLPPEHRCTLQPDFDNMLVPDIYDDEKSSKDQYVVDEECNYLKINSHLQDEMLYFVSAMFGKKEGKKGTWIGYQEDRPGYFMKVCRKWSELPEDKKIHLYVAPNGIAKYYDDIEELDFSPEDIDDECPDMARLMEGSCRFKYHHVDTEEDNEDEDEE